MGQTNVVNFTQQDDRVLQPRQQRVRAAEASTWLVPASMRRREASRKGLSRCSAGVQAAFVEAAQPGGDHWGERGRDAAKQRTQRLSELMAVVVSMRIARHVVVKRRRAGRRH